MDEYKSIAEKKKFYGKNYHQINTLSELKNFINKCVEQENTRSEIYRGVSESRYKIYSSLQRAWIGKDIKSFGAYKSYQDFVNYMLKYLQTNEMLNKYYKALNVEQNDWNAMCFLQHYGAPTPLIDFSYNFKVALYFGIDKQVYSAKNDISGYFSVYQIKADNFTSINKTLAEERNNNIAKIKNNNIKKNKRIIEDITYEKLVSDSNNYPILFDASEAAIPLLISQNKKTVDFNYYVANLNMIAQEGALLLFDNEDIPLEHVILGNMIVYDISKELYPFIRKYLDNMKITSETLFPKQDDIARNLYLSMIDL